MPRRWPGTLRRGLSKTCATLEVSSIINADVSIRFANPICAGRRRGCSMRSRVCSRNKLTKMPIAADVILGRDVRIFQPDLVNLYGCSIGAETKIGAFVEIQKNVS